MSRKSRASIVDVRPKQKWDSGICDCSSHCTRCVFACFVPCFQFGENYQLMHNLEIRTNMDIFVLKNSEGEPYCNPKFCACCVHGTCTVLTIGGPSTIPAVGGWTNTLSCLACCANLFLHTSMRRDIRKKHNIGGSCFGDLCSVLCCYPCALTQEYKELLSMQSQNEDGHTQENPPRNTSSMYAPLQLYY